MDSRFDKIRNLLEGCLQQACIYDRPVDGHQLFEVDIVRKANSKWLVLAAGISESEASEYFSDEHPRYRALSPIRIAPIGKLSFLLIIRPHDPQPADPAGRFFTDFSKDVKAVELYQGSYVRADELQRPTVEQIRWELDAVTGYKPPQEEWLRTWSTIIGCNPAHAPSHWHINSPPLERAGRRGSSQPASEGELRLAVGVPNPLLLMLSLANWLRK